MHDITEPVSVPLLSHEEIMTLEKQPDSIDCDTFETTKKQLCIDLKTGMEYSQMMASEALVFDCGRLKYPKNQESCSTRNELQKQASIIHMANISNDVELCDRIGSVEQRDACRIGVILYPIIINESYKTASGREILKQEGIFQENFEPIAERSCDTLQNTTLIEQCVLDVQKVRSYYTGTGS